MGLTVRDLITISRFCAIDRREYPLIYQGRKLKSAAEIADILMPHVNDEVVRIDFVLDCTALEIKFSESEQESGAQQEKDAISYFGFSVSEAPYDGNQFRRMDERKEG